ncbi:MAG: serine hydrolase, partial [Bacteroidota bacterium]
VCLMAGCTPSPPDHPIENMLQEGSPLMQKVYQQADKFRLQVLYTQIDRDENNQASFTSHSFRLDAEEYFYPASTVKFPVALMAFEKMAALDKPSLDVWTSMLTDSAYAGQSAVKMDSTAENGLPSVAHYAKKLFIVSDNDAFNRLYEFVGQEMIQEKLSVYGAQDSRINHRLAIFLSEDENRHTNPIRFVSEGRDVFQQPMQFHEGDLGFPDDLLLGKGELLHGEVKAGPKDFAQKNVFPLADQQTILRQLIFPIEGKGPALTEGHRKLVLQYLSQLPHESRYPRWDGEDIYPSYCKFLMFGDRKDAIPGNIRIFNKIGLAYGFLTDNAYIVDLENGIEFFLSATIFVNENQIFNDGEYEYDEIAFPFMGELGRAVYELEKKRNRKYRPDLSEFVFSYD